ncbi:MAG TPA: DUF3047 domain-containing protein [Dongiaceae bacterium]|nr:DUF3047 domain-containing protein [Dongiaceae bacterium]
MRFRQQSDISARATHFAVIVALAALASGSAARSDAAPPARMLISPAEPGAWQEQAFVGHTLYRVEDGGRGKALRATADGSASALCRTIQLDLKTLPIVRWSWRLDRPPPRRDERRREGDDQGLRVSFLHRGGTTADSILAGQYVWSQNEPREAGWANAFVPNAHEIAARSGPARPGAWMDEERDLRADFRAAFGQDIDRVDAVCLMTDGDQTGALVEGWYGDIILKAR